MVGSRGSINDVGDTDEDMLVPDAITQTLSQASDDGRFINVNTSWAITLEMLCFIGLEVAVFVVPHFLETIHSDPNLSDGRSRSPLPYYILLYSHGGLWFIVLTFDRFIWFQHHKAQSRGYLEFYRSTRSLRQAPLIIVNLVNAVLIILTTILQQYPIYPPEPSRERFRDILVTKRLELDEDNILQIVLSLEVFSALFCLMVLLIRTVHFNSLRHPPDVQQEETLMQSSAPPGLRGSSSRDIGFRDASLLLDGGINSESNVMNVDELLEKQADMIRYLKSHNANLSRKILKLTGELQSRQSGI